MSEEEVFGQLMRSVIQGMALNLVELATGDDGPKGMQTRNSEGLRHLRITDAEGAVLFQVSGKDTGELAWQLVLSCLHNISIDQLKALHKHPLKRAIQAAK